VQGVGFRASTRAQASRLGLAGHVVNLPDGRVEVLLYGPFEAVERMRTWLWQGPPAARVDAVDCADAPPPLHADFRLLRDF
jgi:acylphosphatase